MTRYVSIQVDFLFFGRYAGAVLGMVDARSLHGEASIHEDPLAQHENPSESFKRAASIQLPRRDSDGHTSIKYVSPT